jgi:hypothetical protein
VKEQSSKLKVQRQKFKDKSSKEAAAVGRWESLKLKDQSAKGKRETANHHHV